MDVKVLETKIQNILNRIRPYLQNDGGDAEFVRYDQESGIVYIRMLGACIGCGSVDSTIKDCIESILLEEVEGVVGVESVEQEL